MATSPSAVSGSRATTAICQRQSSRVAQRAKERPGRPRGRSRLSLYGYLISRRAPSTGRSMVCCNKSVELVSQVAQVALSLLLQPLPGIRRSLIFRPSSLRSLRDDLPAYGRRRTSSTGPSHERTPIAQQRECAPSARSFLPLSALADVGLTLDNFRNTPAR